LSALTQGNWLFSVSEEKGGSGRREKRSEKYRGKDAEARRGNQNLERRLRRNAYSGGRVRRKGGNVDILLPILNSSGTGIYWEGRKKFEKMGENLFAIEEDGDLREDTKG